MSPMDPSSGEDISPWAFALVFLLAPLALGVVATLAYFQHQLSSSPLAISLLVGHLLSAGAVVVAYLVLRRKR